MIRPDLQAPKNNLSVAIPNYCGWSKLSSGMLNDRMKNFNIYI